MSKIQAALLAGSVAAVSAYQWYSYSHIHAVFSDYRAFWCAGSVLLHGGDPYRTAMLLACERAPVNAALYVPPAHVALPAPLPLYGLLGFVPFAMLPYALASLLWIVILAAATFGCVRMFARVSNISPVLAAWILLPPALVFWLPYGEVVPIAFLGALLTIAALRERSGVKAALGLALLALEPHIAAPVWACVFLFEPRMRKAIALTGGALVVAWLASRPFSVIEYFAQVLPLHALAELPRGSQLSASWIAYALTGAPRASLAVGSISYALTFSAGILFAQKLRERTNDAAMLIVLPAFAVLIGGSFLHPADSVFALPLATYVWTQSRDGLKHAGTAAIVLVSVPWFQVPVEPLLIVVVGLAVTQIAGLRAALAATVVAAGLLLIARHDITFKQHAGAFPATRQAVQQASASWGVYVWKNEGRVTLDAWLVKAPFWIALAVLVCGASRIGAHEKPELRVRVDEAPALL